MAEPVEERIQRGGRKRTLAAAGLLMVALQAERAVCAGHVQAPAATAQLERRRIAEERWLRERLDQDRPELGVVAPAGELRAGSGGTELRGPRMHSMRTRLAQIESPVVLELSESEESLLRLLLVSRRGVSARILAYQDLYRPQVQEVFGQEGLPQVLSLLPWAASGWNPAFAAFDGGVGLWALDASTARLYGLRVDGHLDQRRHPVLSSQAAARRLLDLKERFADWRLALAAFGSSPASVETARLKAGRDASYRAIRVHLPVAGRTLVSAFTAAAYLSHFAQAEDLSPARMTVPETMVWTDLQQDVELEMLAESLEIPAQLLRTWNPHILGDRVSAGDGSFRLDARYQQEARRIAGQAPRLDPPPPSSPPAWGTVSQALDYDDLETTSLYVVRRGDSLGRIANIYDVGVSELRAWNGLRGNLIHPGQELLVRAPAPVGRPAAAQAASGEPGDAFYRVRRGDTLSTIAGRYRVSVGQLQRWNALEGTLIRAGQRLRVAVRPSSDRQAANPAAISPSAGPANRDDSASRPKSGFYTVRSGDTLWAIAQRTGLSVRRLERLNPQVRPRDLRPGMRLRLQEASPD